METGDADFYPVTAKRRGGKLIRVLIIILCAALVTALAMRLYSWLSQKRETELLALVNPWNSVDAAEFDLELRSIGGGQKADGRCAAELSRMLADCAAAGNSPVVAAAYRDRETQREVYDAAVRELVEAGSAPEQAEAAAGAAVSRPGYSEHELGLAVDIVDSAYPALDAAQADTTTQQWLMENCWSYGFILRYPADKTELTGTAYSPWHYRYVGVTAAEQMRQLELTLEEYMAMFYSEQAVVIIED